MQNTLNLRDIHLPDAVSWWPPAIGWWLLLAMLVAIIYFAPKLYRRLTFTPLNKVTQRAFENIQLDYQTHNDTLKLVQAISKLLRQISMTYLGRENSAHLTGHAWINSLNNLTEENYFTDEVKDLLLNAPYKKKSSIQANILLKATQDWINALPKDKNNHNKGEKK